MVLGFSYGEVALILGAAVALLGPKELPVIARAAGRLTGKAVGYMQTMRGQVDGILQQSQVHQVQKELRETMAQVDAIRHELRTGMSIMHPGPLTRENLENSTSGLQQVTKVVQKFDSTLDRIVNSVERNPQVATKGLAQSSAELQCQATSYARFAGHLTAGEVQSQIQKVAVDIPSMQTHQADVSSQDGKQIPVLPISAVSMGLFPSRTGPVSGGSDLVVESLAERKVAHQALEFLQQPDMQT